MLASAETLTDACMTENFRISTFAGALALAACGSGPTITSFQTSEASVGFGGPVTLTWAVQDAESLSVSGPGDGTGTVTGNSAVVYPTATGQWVLSATNGHGTTQSQAITISVTANLEVQPGTVNSGSLGTALLFRARDGQGNAPSSDWTVHVTPDAAAGSPLDVQCNAGSATCLVELDALKPLGSGWGAEATIAGEDITLVFNPSSDTLPKATISASYDSANDAIDSGWTAIAGAALYVAQAFDLDSGVAITEAVTSSDTSATLPLTTTLDPNGNYGVQVIAATVDPDQPIAGTLPEPNLSLTVGYLNNLPGRRWAVYGPSDYNGSGQLVVTLPNLGAGEQLAIIPINIGGPDNMTASISVEGTSPVALKAPASVASYLWQIRQQPDRSTVNLRALARTGEARIRSLERQRLARFMKAHPNYRMPLRKTAKVSPSISAAVVGAPPTTSFCVNQGLAADAFVRKNATLEYESAHAIFYVDDDDAAEYSGFDWHDDGTRAGLADLWDDTIHPKDTGTFGDESDIDGNGKLIVFFTHELGAVTPGGIVLGYYIASDVVGSQDTSASCDNSGGTGGATYPGSNHADMFYMNDLANIEGANYSPAQITDEIYPDTLGHEFQHLINFWQHSSHNGGVATSEITWINEGLSVTAEDIVGFGWNNVGGRADGSRYFAHFSDDGYERYYDASLTQWEGDPIGNYQGSHSFFRYFTDRMGPWILGALDQTAQTRLPNLESVLGETFEQAYAEWTISLMFSNEVFSPDPSRFDFSGLNWTPLHSALNSPTSCPYPGHDGHVGYLPLDTSVTTALRTDGWSAFVTGTGNNGPVTITVSPGAPTAYLAVVRFSGTLPNGDLASCP